MASVTAELDEGGRRLELVSADGRRLTVEADLLWRECPSAAFRRRRIDGHQLVAPPGVTITDLRPIGHYGVNLVFSDGNDRGIYPWALIAELALRPTVDDFLLPRSEVAAHGNRHTTGEAS